MAKKIRNLADANGVLLPEITKRQQDLAKVHRPSGKDEAVIRAASERDRRKFIPARMN